ncbi:MAG: glycoside hydrolase family 3 protein [Oscillospiraceae bacterium]|nr:glycoside hydrolase family 3 protein [Oscillospiraceae bacterium]
MELRKHARFLYQPVLPLGKNLKMVTNSKAHWDVALQGATEGTVLLKNEGVLPLKQGTRLSLFGLGAGDFLFGGGGSGRVYTENKITLDDALRAAADRGELEYFAGTADFYKEEIGAVLAQGMSAPALFMTWRSQNQMQLPVMPDSLYDQAKAFGGTAIFCLSRYSSEGDTAGDRTGGEGDFYLWEDEKKLLDRLCADFDNVVVVLNTCGPVSVREYKDNPKIGAVLYPLFGGGMAGTALVNVLMGHSYPSGHLQHTIAYDLADYPSTKGFHDFEDHVDYTEDIFVGYRYFETFAPDKVAYPYGFGLGYTTFAVEKQSAALDKFTVNLTVKVTNTGSFAGKEVVQAYLSAPQGKLGKPAKVLCAFEKTRELKPGESCLLKLHFDIRDFASFDDLGKVAPTAFVLEKGQYLVHVGANVRDTQSVFSFMLDEDMVCRKCRPYMAPRALEERLCAAGTMEKLPKAEKIEHKPLGYRLKTKGKPEQFPLIDAYKQDRLDEFMASLTDGELAELLYGRPIMNPSNTNGIGMAPKYEREDVKLVPLVPTADGPMGLRIREGRGVLPTFFPGESAMAQTWNLPLIRRSAVCIAREAKENNIGIWLAPAMNIQRNPMCGRNFEYYSEDPLASGLCATAAVKGAQSEKIAATIKHFCCNNRENDRRLADSRVSQRALREIYLRGFEIAVKKAHPWALMTSYNPVNGEQMSKNWEALNGILRTEWNYQGVVMTDWRTLANIDEELHAGGDVKMPELITKFYKNAPKSCNLEQMVADGTLDRNAVMAAVRRILLLMEHLD